MNVLQWARAQWDRVLAGILFVFGGVAILLGWAGVRQEALTAAQIPYVVSGGLGGISLIGVGAVFWLSADLRDEWRKLDDLDAASPASSSDRTETAEIEAVGLTNGTKPVPTRPSRTRPLRAGSR